MTVVQVKVILKSIQNLTEKEDDKEGVEASAPVADDEVTLLRQELACTFTDDDSKSLL